MTWNIPLVALLLFLAPAAVQHGERGNDALRDGNLMAAMEAYEMGLESAPSTAVRHALHYNQGLALLAAGEGEASAAAFEQAAAFASGAPQRAQARLGAGVAAAQGGSIQGALAHLRAALLLDPDFDAARRNYEILARMADQQEETPPRPEPSDFARRARATADSLIAIQQYRAALTTMESAAAQDSTVATYADFIGRLSGVVEVDEALQDDR
ncbi:hypothetical protein BH23BAC4_BH23BAC4_13250 [soil metagenome]